MRDIARWVGVNVIGASLGIGIGIAIAQGFLLWAPRLPFYKETSGVPVGWSLYVVLLIFTLDGAMGAVIGYALRQRLVQRRVERGEAVGYALAGAVLWPVVAACFVVVMVCVVAPLTEALFPDVRGGYADFLVWLDAALAVAILGVLVGSVVAALKRDEVS